jgi:hypothetical protein
MLLENQLVAVFTYPLVSRIVSGNLVDHAERCVREVDNQYLHVESEPHIGFSELKSDYWAVLRQFD